LQFKNKLIVLSIVILGTFSSFATLCEQWCNKTAWLAHLEPAHVEDELQEGEDGKMEVANEAVVQLATPDQAGHREYQHGYGSHLPRHAINLLTGRRLLLLPTLLYDCQVSISVVTHGL